MQKEANQNFNFDNANLADQITVIGNLEHVYYHANKSASVVPKEEAVFYQTVADMTKEFRRDFMRRHFPDVKDEDWCLLKAVETVRQRVYESAHTSHEDLKAINDLWSIITEHIFGVDMSGCVACKEDRGEDSGEISEEEARERWPGVMEEFDKEYRKGSHEDSLS